MVHPGDTVAEEDPLITLESDKATMDVPSPAAGTVRELKVSVGDKVSEGTVILTLDGAATDGAGGGEEARERVEEQATPEPAGAAAPSYGSEAGEYSAIEVRVPDIGDFSDVPIIEVMVGPGDTVAEEDPLVTLESDKATMDVPSPAAGTVRELSVRVGDTVSEGSLILPLDGAATDGAGAKEHVEEDATPEPATDEPVSYGSEAG